MFKSVAALPTPRAIKSGTSGSRICAKTAPIRPAFIAAVKLGSETQITAAVTRAELLRVAAEAAAQAESPARVMAQSSKIFKAICTLPKMKLSSATGKSTGFTGACTPKPLLVNPEVAESSACSGEAADAGKSSEMKCPPEAISAKLPAKRISVSTSSKASSSQKARRRFFASSFSTPVCSSVG